MREALGADPPGLLERLRAGEPRAFEELVTAYQHRVFGVALRMLGSRAEAEEIAQEVFLRAYRALADFRGDARLGTWLYGIASRLCLNRLASPDRRVARGHRRAAGGPASRVGAPRRRGVIVRRDRGGPRSRSRHRALAAAPRAPAIEGEAGAVRMTCTETRDLFSALADDALTPAERAALDAHLAGCAECRRELAGLLRTVKLVRAPDPARA